MQSCSKCGREKRVELTLEQMRRRGRPRGLGGSTTQYCACAPLRTVYKHGVSAPRPKSQKSSRLSIAEQLAVLAELREQGSLTEQEFQTLKTRLISGGDS